MQDRIGLPHWAVHDLRRTALTKMAELGVPPIVLGHIANHRTTTKAGITLGVYVQHAYEREKREALELWASRLQGIISGGGADVVATLERAAIETCLPKTIRVDNGPEFVSKELDLWAFIRGVALEFVHRADVRE